MTPEQVNKARAMMNDQAVETNGAIMDAVGIGMKELFSLRWYLVKPSDSDAAEYYNAHLASLPNCQAINAHFDALEAAK